MSKTLSPQSEWLRANTKAQIIGVDRENDAIRGFVVAEEGPFKTPGRGEFDRDGLKAMLAIIQQQPKGLKSRFAHPTISDDGLGKYLGRVKKPWIDKTAERWKLRADLEFDASAHATPSGDLAGYLLDRAESDPESLSSSVVIVADKEYRLNKDGTRQRSDEGDELPPIWKPKRLHASDVVDTGDAVNGFLSADIDGQQLPDVIVRQACELLDTQFADADRATITSRAESWLKRYLDHRFGGDEETAAEADAGDTAPALSIRQRRQSILEKTLAGE